MYEQADRSIARLKTVITREFRKLFSLAFDEITSITAPKIVEQVYTVLVKENKKEYKKICDDAIEYALVFLEELQEQYGGTDFFFDRKEVEEGLNADKIVESILKEYDPVTGYVYDRETERKKARTTEGMIAGQKSKERAFYTQSVERSRNLWFTQTRQYADDVAEQTAITVWKKAGIKYVRWVTAADEKVCSKCRPLDGQIFPIDEAPPKQHYNCRCLKVPFIR